MTVGARATLMPAIPDPACTGEGVPWKVHVRAPSFVHMGGVHKMLDGYQLADIVPTFGSVNMIGGECDR